MYLWSENPGPAPQRTTRALIFSLPLPTRRQARPISRLRWLKILARLPIQDNTWLGFGHTVPNDKAFAENTKLSGVILTSAAGFGEEVGECTLPDGTCVTFYRMIPIYKEEMNYKIEYGAEALFDLMEEDQVDHVLDIQRPNLCSWEVK